MEENSRDGLPICGAVALPETARSRVWQYFTKIDQNQAKCNECTKALKVAASSTTSLWRHYRTHADSKVDVNASENVAPLDEKSARAKELTLAIAKMIIWDLEPYNLVNRRGFRNLMRTLEPRYTIPSRTTFSRDIIPLLYAQETKRIKMIIHQDIEEGVTSIALNTDGWTSRAIESYISLTLHYVTKNFERRTFTLAMTYLAESHTTKNLHDVLQATIIEWGLDDASISSIFFVTDNAANIVAAIRMGDRWIRIPCFAHTLSLVVKDAVQASPAFTSICRKTQAIVSFFARSSSGHAKLDNAQKHLAPGKNVLKLIQNVVTRWNSEYEMFERLLTLRKALSVVLCDRGMPANLTESEWESVRTYVEILQPVKEATDLMSGETYPGLSQYMPVVETLKKAAISDIIDIEVVGEVNANECDLIGPLSAALHRRFAFVNSGNDPMVFAMILDPHYKDRFIQSATEKHEAIKRLKWKATLLYEMKFSVVSDKPNASRSNAEDEPKSKLRKLFENFLNSEENDDDENIDIELKAYLEEKVQPRSVSVLKWWAKNHPRFPMLASLARQYLNIPAAQTTSERLFSTAGNIVTQSRAQLLSSHVEQLAFLHENFESCV